MFLLGILFGTLGRNREEKLFSRNKCLELCIELINSLFPGEFCYTMEAISLTA